MADSVSDIAAYDLALVIDLVAELLAIKIFCGGIAEACVLFVLV